MQTSNAVLESTKRAMQFLLPPHDAEAERETAMQHAAKLMLEVTTAFIRAGRDDLAFRASELARDAR
ncbi:hypothetical protein [Burkholderia pseudomultivorans]|uniref:hypothetical protein n=1 Tax=Burkholderia pseudomultivorans TaxID=1207504 RepID=UPI000A74176E|nr:hypothetical protein [Burkholderia pseudomultivorans]